MTANGREGDSGTMTQTTTRLEVTPVGGGIGADIHGADLSVEQPEETYAEIRATLCRYGVVFFHDQDLDADAHERLSRHFGEPMSTQELRKEPEQTRNIGGGWHVDLTFLPEPPFATMLVAKQLPERGGDTMWSSMALAYEALSDGLRATLDSMWAVHANVRNLALSYEHTDPPEPSIDDYDKAEGTLHPVVVAHPETGRRSLFLNPEYTTRFEGWTRRESLPLLEYLYQHAARPEFTTRLRWRPGMVAFWDNRQVWHNAVNDYTGMLRVMSRSVIRGQAPKPAVPR